MPNAIEITPATRLYHLQKGGGFRLFDLSTCETCGAVIMAPNSFCIDYSSGLMLSRAGVPILPTLPPEGFYDEATDQEACYACPTTNTAQEIAS